jgi:hypothetical protein
MIDLFHDSIVKRLHKLIYRFITVVVHFNFLRVTLHLKKHIPTDIRITVLQIVIDHIHQLYILANILKLFVKILFQDRYYIL